VGPAADRDRIDVRFQSSKGDIACLPSEVSREPPPTTLDGGFRVGDRVYWASASGKSSNGDRVVYGQQGTVTGPSRDKDRVAVQFSGNKMGFRGLPSELSRTPPPTKLAGGFRRGEQVYFVGDREALPTNVHVEYGQLGEVTGLATVNGRVHVQFPNDRANVALRPRDLGREPPPKLVGGYKVGEQAYWALSGQTLPNGDRVVYGQQGVVTGYAKEKDRVGVWFADNKQVVECLPWSMLSRKAPPTTLAGGYKFAEKVYYFGVGLEFANGIRIVHGQQGEIIGPARDREKVTVYFPGNKANKAGATCLPSELSREPPSTMLAGGFKVGDKVYWASAGGKLSNGDRVVYGKQGKVTGRATDNDVAVLFLGNKVRESVTCLPSELSRKPPPKTLAGGYQVGDKAYWVVAGRSATGDLLNGVDVKYGQWGTVTGPTSATDIVGITVQFPTHELAIACIPGEEVAGEVPPKKLAGGYKLGDKAYWAGATQTFADGDRIAYGQLGEVMGPAEAMDVKGRLALYFSGNSGIIKCLHSSLSRKPPPTTLAGGYKVGDKVYWAGLGQTFANGMSVAHSQLGEVLGPVADNKDRVLVQFQGNKGGFKCLPIDLSREPLPTTLAGGFKVGDKVYWVGEEGRFPNWDRVVYGQQGTVTGQGTDEQVGVLFPGNKAGVRSLPGQLSRKQPPKI